MKKCNVYVEIEAQLDLVFAAAQAVAKMHGDSYFPFANTKEDRRQLCCDLASRIWSQERFEWTKKIDRDKRRAVEILAADYHKEVKKLAEILQTEVMDPSTPDPASPSAPAS